MKADTVTTSRDVTHVALTVGYSTIQTMCGGVVRNGEMNVAPRVTCKRCRDRAERREMM